MADAPAISVPLSRLGRLQLKGALRALAPGGPVVTATIGVPDAPGNPQYAWDTAWSQAGREAAELGADQATAGALIGGSGDVTHQRGSRAVVAAGGTVLLGAWLAGRVGADLIRVGPLPHLTPVAAGLALRPAYVAVLADRDGTDVIAHAAGSQDPAERFLVGKAARGARADHHDDLPPAHKHGERHITDSEPESGGQVAAEHIAGRVSDAARAVGAHVVIGAGDQHILAAVARHLPPTIGPVTAIDGHRVPAGTDDHLRTAIDAALDQVTEAAVNAVADLVASGTSGDTPIAVRGVKDVAEQLAEQQVAVLVLAPDIAAEPQGGYRIGTAATEFLVGDADAGTDVPLEDGLVWAALHQDAIVIQLADRSGALAGEPAAALLRRGTPRRRGAPDYPH